MPLLTQLHCLRVPERIKFKLAVLVYRCLHPTAPPYLAEELHQSSAGEARQRLRSASTSSLFCPTHPSFNHRRSSFSGRCCPTVEHSAAERHVGIVNILFSGNIWTPISSVILSPNLLLCLCYDFVISDTIIDLFTTMQRIRGSDLMVIHTRDLHPPNKVWMTLQGKKLIPIDLCLPSKTVGTIIGVGDGGGSRGDRPPPGFRSGGGSIFPPPPGFEPQKYQ